MFVKKLLEIFVISLLLCITGCTNSDDNNNFDSSTSETLKYLRDNLFSFDYESSTDSYVARAFFSDYEIVFDFTDSDFSRWNLSSEIFLPYSVYKNGRKINSGEKVFSGSSTKGGILLSFDDYFDCWNTYLPLFTQYGVKATWFCFGDYSRFGTFAVEAQNQGQEVGFHTAGHIALSTCDTDEKVAAQAITPLQDLKAKNLELNSFAFPYGASLQFQMAMLLEHYKILRLFDNHFRLYSVEDISKQRIIFSQSIDKNKFVDDTDFKNTLIKRIILAQITGKIYPCTTHYILTTKGEISTDAYTISKENLVLLFEVLNALNCKTYLYKDFYPYMY